ncbi:MAG: hypothetical protein MRY78_09095 [Saprospiraceae bacterium]|nr:hypothetical protein [Saprospiraceae bacterium]
MKKWWWIGVLVLVVFIGDRLAGWGLGQLVMSSEFRYSRMYRGEAGADLLLIGNSRGLVFYQPYLEEKLPYSTFNMSYNGMPADLMDVLLKDYLDLYPKPKLVLIDVTLCDRFNDELINGFSTYAGQSDRLKRLIRSKNTTTANALEVSWLYRYNSEVFQRAMFYLNKSDEDWLLDRTITEEIKRKLSPDYEFIIKYPEEMPVQLGQTVAFLRKQDIPFQLIVNPYYPPFLNHVTNLDIFIRDIEQSCQAEVLNLAKAIPEEDYFGDFQHLNKKGSEAYLEKLIDTGVIAIQ